jgi:hypothetical protein
MSDTKLSEILKTEFSHDFVEKMKNSMVVSFHKYGPIDSAFPDRVDAVASLMDRLRLYTSTGNTEALMDVANFAMIEYMRPSHPDAHYTPTDDDGSPGRVAKGTGSRSGRVHAHDKRDNATIGTNPGSKIAAIRGLPEPHNSQDIYRQWGYYRHER